MAKLVQIRPTSAVAHNGSIRPMRDAPHVIRLAVDMKFPINIHIRIHRRPCRVNVAHKFLQNTAVQKRPFLPSKV